MEKDELIIRPLQSGISIINENPIGILEKLGKYEFIYDYKVPNFFYNSQLNLNIFKKEGGSNANMIAPTKAELYQSPSGYWSGTNMIAPTKAELYQPSPSGIAFGEFTQSVEVNSEPQVGVFSKGNIVNVLRFDGNNAIIQNPNFVEPDPNAPKISFWVYLGDVTKQKEFSIPKDYLRKVDDTLAVTVSTGILYGANPKPQPVYNQSPLKTIPFNPINQTILEENANFALTKDFTYQTNEYVNTCPQGVQCITGGYYKQGILKAGTKVIGRLFREIDNTAYKVQMGAIMPPNFKDYLAVKGYGYQGSINIPIEYLTKELPTNSGSGNNTNSGIVLPAEDNNKNLLMIVGAFLVGYVLFNKGKGK